MVRKLTRSIIGQIYLQWLKSSLVVFVAKRVSELLENSIDRWRHVKGIEKPTFSTRVKSIGGLKDTGY